MNGFTGLDINQAASNIAAFEEAMKAAATLIKNGGSALFDTLHDNWYSDKAVEFSTNYSGRLYEETVTLIEQSSDSLADQAIAAVNTMSTANGGPSLPRKSLTYPSIEYTFGFLDSTGPNGVGMNIDVVGNALQEFMSVVESTKSAIDSVPSDIALYDKSGYLKQTFKDVVAKIKSSITTVTDEVTKALQTALDEQMQELHKATGNASDALGGRGSGNGSNPPAGDRRPPSPPSQPTPPSKPSAPAPGSDPNGPGVEPTAPPRPDHP